MTVTPPAADPVSVGVVATLQTRLVGITTYSSTAAAITAVRGHMVTTSAAAYTEQEGLNSASLNGTGSGGGAAAPPAPPAHVPMPTIPQIPVPPIPAPPGTGREISELIHSGPGPQSLLGAAQQLRSHAGELRSTSSSLRGHSGQLTTDWPSESGQRASARISELASWYDQHAEHATDAADSMQSYGESFTAAKNKIPTPQQFQDVENRLQAAASANANPANMGRYAPVVAKYQTELAGLNTKAMGGWSDLARAGGDPSVAGKPLQAPPHPQGIQALDMPESPAPTDPDSKYWLDLSTLKHYAPGALGPSGYKELVRGSGVWYPDPDGPSSLTVGGGPSGPPKAPLDLGDIKHYAPGALGPYGNQELIPGSGTWVPDPGSPTYSQSPPKFPVDTRYLFEVPEGQLAPSGSVEIAPHLWYTPSQTVNVPQMPKGAG
jgi:hypothetical protein